MQSSGVLKITPLEGWVEKITGGDLAAYQLSKLNETLAAAQNGSYYRRTLPRRIDSLSELTSLPTIDAETLTQSGTGLVCVPQSEISRVVTLTTSGSTGEPKRVYFTEEDQELTVDYFANGLTTVLAPGGTMAIMLPCERHGGVGDLIARSLERIPAIPVRHGLVGDLASCAFVLRDSGADSLVGVPVQALAVARYCEVMNIRTKITSVLLSTDSIPDIVRRELKRIWGCEVYEHYGMTEMGLGGAIDCDAHEGYHIRENDLLFEILDEKGNRVPDGTSGEVVFTTLTRRGMPFVRYRTGDISRLIPGRCTCGSWLRRIAPIERRIGGDIVMACGRAVTIRGFDEVLLSERRISDFTLTASPRENSLLIEIETQEELGETTESDVRELLNRSGLTDGIEVALKITNRPNVLTARTGKRRIKLMFRSCET